MEELIIIEQNGQVIAEQVPDNTILGHGNEPKWVVHNATPEIGMASWKMGDTTIPLEIIGYSTKELYCRQPDCNVCRIGWTNGGYYFAAQCLNKLGEPSRYLEGTFA